MDIGTLIGIVSGFILVAVSIMMGGDIMSFIDIPSLVVVLGGTICAVLVAQPMSRVKEIVSITKVAFLNNVQNPNETIDYITEIANKARKEGLLSLEEMSSKLEDDFFKKGITLIVDGTDPELVRTLLETEMGYLEERHKLGQGLFENMGSLAPAFGMVGTLIGLVNMLKDLSDPNSIGPSMAVALITTFYGSLFANLIFIPIANKLKLKSQDELLNKEVILEGLLSIQAGENPRIIEAKLKAFLPPALRKPSEGDANNG